MLRAVGTVLSSYQLDRRANSLPVIKEEIETATQLVGMTDLMRDASPVYINTAGIDHLLPPNYGLSIRDTIGRMNKL